jgi:NAD-dependent dihydropyrimidine dehydrogenase PreA subunit
MYVIDQTRCMKCGLCITRCPSEAIDGVNEHSVAGGVAFDQVTIDPERCIECGLCSPADKPCLMELDPADGTKYDKYFYHYDFDADPYYRRYAQTEQEAQQSAELFKQLPWKFITRLDHDAMPGSNFYVLHWVFPHDEPMGGVGHPPHIHRDAELIMVIGGNPEKPEELGAEIEMYMGPEMERHIITKSCVIFIPPYFMHCPWRILKTTSPWIFCEVNQGPHHTEKLYNQLLPSEAVDVEEMSFFRDEGFDD